MTGTLQMEWPSHITHVDTVTQEDGHHRHKIDDETYRDHEHIGKNHLYKMVISRNGFKRSVQFATMEQCEESVNVLEDTDGLLKATIRMNKNEDGEGAFEVRIHRHRPKLALWLDDYEKGDPCITNEKERFDSYSAAADRFYEVLPDCEYDEIRIGTVGGNFERLDNGSLFSGD